MVGALRHRRSTTLRRHEENEVVDALISVRAIGAGPVRISVGGRGGYGGACWGAPCQRLGGVWQQFQLRKISHILVEDWEQDSGDNHFDVAALLGLWLCFCLIVVGDQEFMAFPLSSAVEFTCPISVLTYCNII